MGSTNGMAEIWAEIVAQHDARADRLVTELRGAWADLDEVVTRQAARFPPDRRWRWPEGPLESFAWLFDDIADELLEGPISAYNTTRPQRRALKALHEYQSGLEQLLRSVPAEVELAPAELADALQSKAKSRAFPLRDVLAHHLRDQTDEMAALNGKLLLALARGCMALIEPWEVVRGEVLRKLEGWRFHAGPYRRQADRWLRRISSNRREAQRLLTKFSAWRNALHYRLEMGLLADRAHVAVPGELPLGQLPFAAYWSRQRQALSAQLELECRMVSLGQAALRQNQRALSAMKGECRAALDDLSEVETWLERWSPDAKQDFPRPQLNVTSAKNRTADWISDLAESAKQKLPATLEIGEPRGALPGWREPWQKLHPHHLFKQSLADAAEPKADGWLRRLSAIYWRRFAIKKTPRANSALKLRAT